MVSRVGLIAMVALVAALVGTTAAARQPPTGTAMFVVRHDPRLCPSPLCGGYWVALANAARTRCADGLRHVRCYAARAVDARGGPIGDIPEGGLVRGVIGAGRDDLGELVARAVYPPVGRAQVFGGYYRLQDTGLRCLRAPCFSYRVTQVNGSTRTRVSGIDLSAARVITNQFDRAEGALHARDGLYARGLFVRGKAGELLFRATKLYLRAPLPRA